MAGEDEDGGRRGIGGDVELADNVVHGYGSSRRWGGEVVGLYLAAVFLHDLMDEGLGLFVAWGAWPAFSEGGYLGVCRLRLVGD